MMERSIQTLGGGGHRTRGIIRNTDSDTHTHTQLQRKECRNVSVELDAAEDQPVAFSPGQGGTVPGQTVR